MQQINGSPRRKHSSRRPNPGMQQSGAPVYSLLRHSCPSGQHQTPPQSKVGGAHLGDWHAPFTQSWPAGQTLPHPPQLFGSVVVSTHAPLQTVSLPGSFSTHTLFTSSWHGSSHGG